MGNGSQAIHNNLCFIHSFQLASIDRMPNYLYLEVPFMVLWSVPFDTLHSNGEIEINRA